MGAWRSFLNNRGSDTEWLPVHDPSEVPTAELSAQPQPLHDLWGRFLTGRAEGTSPHGLDPRKKNHTVTLG